MQKNHLNQWFEVIYPCSFAKVFLTKKCFYEKNHTIALFFKKTYKKDCIFATGLVVKGRLG